MNHRSQASLALHQSPRLGLDVRAKVNGVVGVAARHERQLAGRVVEEYAGELVASYHLLHLFARGLVAGCIFLSVDALKHLVGVANEVHQEEDGWVGCWKLHLRVGFECTVVMISRCL